MSEVNPNPSAFFGINNLLCSAVPIPSSLLDRCEALLNPLVEDENEVYYDPQLVDDLFDLIEEEKAFYSNKPSRPHSETEQTDSSD